MLLILTFNKSICYGQKGGTSHDEQTWTGWNGGQRSWRVSGAEIPAALLRRCALYPRRPVRGTRGRQAAGGGGSARTDRPRALSKPGDNQCYQPADGDHVLLQIAEQLATSKGPKCALAEISTAALWLYVKEGALEPSDTSELGLEVLYLNRLLLEALPELQARLAPSPAAFPAPVSSQCRFKI